MKLIKMVCLKRFLKLSMCNGGDKYVVFPIPLNLSMLFYTLPVLVFAHSRLPFGNSKEMHILWMMKNILFFNFVSNVFVYSFNGVVVLYVEGKI